MKHFLLVASLACSLAGASAQGTIEFTVSLNGANEVPPNGSPGFGSGTWTLRGSSLDYVVTTSVLFQGGAQATDMTLNGPAGAGSTAPVLFDLGAPTLIPIQPPPGAYYSWNDTINNLTSGQISDLLGGGYGTEQVSVLTVDTNEPLDFTRCSANTPAPLPPPALSPPKP
jgi:CHRD domain